MKHLVTILAVLLSISAAGQTVEWNGKVVDEDGNPLQYANAVLMSMPDSTLLSGAVTDENGHYSIISNDMNNILVVSMIGYRTVYLAQPQAEVKLDPETEMLGEASVTAVMPKTKLTDQGMLTSVRGSVLENIGTAEDALSRVPGIIKSQDGLQVLGSGAPLFYINGRKVTDVTELERIPSSEIQSVEVITNPGAQYDATVRSVIKIKTIKHQGDGFGFNTGFTDEQSLRDNINDPSFYFNGNFRHNGLDLFAGTNLLKFTSVQDSYAYQETFAGPGFHHEGLLYAKGTTKDIDINGGFNLQLNENHSLGARIEMNYFPSEDVYQIIEEDVYRGEEKIDHLIAEGHHKSDSPQSIIQMNTYYNGDAGKLNIDFNADGYFMENSQNANTDEKSESAEDDNVNYISHNSSKLFASKLVLTYPVWIGSIQAGTEDTFTRYSDDYTINTDAVPSSISEVKEDNIALFANYGFYLPKIGQFSVGVRYEHVNYDYVDKLSEDDIHRKYDNLFPTFSYANAFGPVQMQLSYSAKTSRPPFSALSSAVRYHSRFMYQSGNPKLQPQQSHDFALNVNWNFLTMVSRYSRTDKAMFGWSDLYNDEGVIIVHPFNCDTPFRTLTWLLNAAPTIGIWNLNYTAGLVQQWLTLAASDSREASGVREIKFNDKPMFVAQIYNTLSFKHNWQIEIGGEYHSKAYTETDYISNNYLDVTAAVQKSFFNNSLVVRLEGRDLAGLANYDVIMDCGNQILKQSNVMDTQRIQLSVRYNFNTAKSKYKGTGAGNETTSRLGK